MPMMMIKLFNLLESVVSEIRDLPWIVIKKRSCVGA